MRVHLIAIDAVEATPNPTGRAAALASASRALAEHGLLDELRAAGGEVAHRAAPRLHGDEISGDPIANLGRLNAHVAETVAEAIADGAFPLLAGGTCSHLIGMLAGLQRGYGTAARIGLVWLDAHGDFNTPRTSHSGMLGGMPVAVAAGLCHAPWRELAGMAAPLPTDRIVMVDVRNLDPEERALIEATDVQIARFGPPGDLATADVVTAIQALAGRVDHLYLHVDADVLDARFQPNHPTVEPGGPAIEPVVEALRAAMATGKVRAFAVVSINPDGPEGEASLASGARLIVEGVRARAGQSAGV